MFNTCFNELLPKTYVTAVEGLFCIRLIVWFFK